MTTFPRSYHVKKAIITAALTAVSLIALSSVAAAAPPHDVFEDNNNTWACEAEADPDLPPDHCINTRSSGTVGLIMVLDGDPRWPAESVSGDPKFASRPCPHDPNATDGTWYQPEPGAPRVCHHKP